MGEASRRKGLVDDIRKKLGEAAAQAAAALEAQVQHLHLQHKALAREIEGFRLEVSAAKAAPAELRRDVLAFRGDLAMKAEQLEALGMRMTVLEQAWPRLVDAGEVQILEKQLTDRLALAIDTVDQRLYTIRYNAGVDARHVRRLETLTFPQRLRWLPAGHLPELR